VIDFKKEIDFEYQLEDYKRDIGLI